MFGITGKDWFMSLFAVVIIFVALGLSHIKEATATPVTTVCPVGSSGSHVLSGWVLTTLPASAPILYNHTTTRHDNCAECERARSLLIDSNIERYSASNAYSSLPNKGAQSTSIDITALRIDNGGKIWTEGLAGTNIPQATRIVSLTCLPTTLL